MATKKKTAKQQIIEAHLELAKQYKENKHISDVNTCPLCLLCRNGTQRDGICTGCTSGHFDTSTVYNNWVGCTDRINDARDSKYCTKKQRKGVIRFHKLVAAYLETLPNQVFRQKLNTCDKITPYPKYVRDTITFIDKHCC